MLKRYVVLSVLVFACLVPLGFGAWSQTSKEGGWESDLHDFWESVDNATWHTCSLDFDYGYVVNFTEWKGDVWQECHGWGYDVWDDDFEVKTLFVLVDDASSHTVELEFWARGSTWFDWILDYSAFNVWVDGVEVKHDWWQGFSRFYFDVYKDGSDLVIKERVYSYDWVLLGGFDYSVDVGSSWFANVSLSESIEGWGKGWCLGYKTNEGIKGDNESPEGTSTEIPSAQQSFWSRLWEGIRGAFSVLPEPLRSWFNLLNEWVGSLWNILVMVWGFVVAFLPMFPLLYGLSFIGVIIAGVTTGNGDLIFDYIYKQYEIVVAFVNTISGVIHTIWALIKIW